MSSCFLGMIKRTIHYKNADIMVSLYKSLVRPHVEYAVSAWSPYYKKDKDLFERVQHRFTRLVKGLKCLNYNERLKVLGLWTLEERRNRSDLIEVFKMYKGFTKVDFNKFFVTGTDLGTRGHIAKISKVRCDKDIRRIFSHTWLQGC